MNKLIVIIGAGPGLGFSVAKRFAREGFDSVLVARNDAALKDSKRPIKRMTFLSVRFLGHFLF